MSDDTRRGGTSDSTILAVILTGVALSLAAFADGLLVAGAVTPFGGDDIYTGGIDLISALLLGLGGFVFLVAGAAVDLAALVAWIVALRHRWSIAPRVLSAAGMVIAAGLVGIGVWLQLAMRAL
jgi:hypothetical protein